MKVVGVSHSQASLKELVELKCWLLVFGASYNDMMKAGWDNQKLAWIPPSKGGKIHN